MLADGEAAASGAEERQRHSARAGAAAARAAPPCRSALSQGASLPGMPRNSLSQNTGMVLLKGSLQRYDVICAEDTEVRGDLMP